LISELLANQASSFKELREKN